MRDLDKRSMALSIIGFLFLIAGIITIIAGNNIYDNFQEQVLYFYENGTPDPTGLYIMYGGIGGVAVGVMFLIASFILVIRSHRHFSDTIHDQDYDEFDDMVASLAGNKTIFDVFYTEDEKKVISFYRNKTCILKEGETVLRGTMEPLEWEAGHPTLWRITLNSDETEREYKVSKVERNILVKGDEGEEIFYRK